MKRTSARARIGTLNRAIALLGPSLVQLLLLLALLVLLLVRIVLSEGNT